MARDVHPTEAGAADMTKEVDIDDLWSNKTTGLTPLHDTPEVGNEALRVARGNPHETKGGVRMDSQTEHVVSKTNDRRRAERIPEDSQSHPLLTQEMVNSRLEEDEQLMQVAQRVAEHNRLQKYLNADEIARITEALDDPTAIMEAARRMAKFNRMAQSNLDHDQPVNREARSRQALADMPRHYEMVGNKPNRKAIPTTREVATFDELPAPVTREQVMEDEHARPAPGEFGAVEVEPAPEVPQEHLTQDELADANEIGQQLFDKFCDHYGLETQSRAFFSKLAAQELLATDKSTYNVTFDLIDSMHRLPGVRQPIADIDPFDQQDTTIVAEVSQLWDPNDPNSQRQVGLVSDGTGQDDICKFTIFRASGDKPTVRVGDKVVFDGVKVNAEKKNGEWLTNLVVTSDTEVHRKEHGDGDRVVGQVAQSQPTRPHWAADSDSHQWLTALSENDNTEVGDTEMKMVTIGYGDSKMTLKEDDNGKTYFAVECENHRLELVDGPDITMKQRTREMSEPDAPKLKDLEDEIDIGPESSELCPECQSTNTTSYQQQVGGADEGMTGFHKCGDCDHSWRSGY